MDTQKRVILVTLNPRHTKEGKISVSLLSNTLNSLQRAAYYMGNYRIDRDPKIPGPYLSMLKRELELFFIRAEPGGSLTATLEMQEKEASLFPDYPDFAENISSDLNQTILGIKEKNAELIHKTIIIPEYRKKVIDELYPIIPVKNGEYEISFKFGGNPIILNVENPGPEYIEKFIGPIREEKEKPKEAIIQARCLARLKKDGRVDKILNVFNYELFEEMDLRPYRTSEIEWQNRKFVLKKEIACDVRKEDSAIIIEYEPLKISVCNYSRKDAINDFAEEFAALWDNYVKEDDRNLTLDAIALKQALISLTDKIEPI